MSSSCLLLLSSIFLSSALNSVLSLNGLGTVTKNLDDAPEDDDVELETAGADNGRLSSWDPISDFFFQMLIASLGSDKFVPSRLGVPPKIMKSDA